MPRLCRNSSTLVLQRERPEQAELGLTACRMCSLDRMKWCCERTVKQMLAKTLCLGCLHTSERWLMKLTKPSILVWSSNTLEVGRNGSRKLRFLRPVGSFRMSCAVFELLSSKSIYVASCLGICL